MLWFETDCHNDIPLLGGAEYPVLAAPGSMAEE